MKKVFYFVSFLLSSTMFEAIGQKYIPAKGYNMVYVDAQGTLIKAHKVGSNMPHYLRSTVYQLANGKCVFLHPKPTILWGSDGNYDMSKIKPVKSPVSFDYFMFANERYGIGWVKSGKLYQTYDSGRNFRFCVDFNKEFPKYGHELVSVHFFDQNTGFALAILGNNTEIYDYSTEYHNVMYRTVNGGRDWVEIGIPKSYQDCYFNSPPHFLREQGKIYMLIKGSPYMCISSDNGQTWSEKKVSEKSAKPFIYLPK